MKIRFFSENSSTTITTVLAAVIFTTVSACTVPALQAEEQLFDEQAVIDIVRVLSDDALAGRAPGTEGSAMARAVIKGRLETLGVGPVGSSYEHGFLFGSFGGNEQGEPGRPTQSGVNILAQIDGTSGSDQLMVISAHYDHIGIIDGEIYNGADDNASGVGGLLAIADYFSRNPPEHDMLFAAFDAEDSDFGGSLAFMADPPVPLERIAFNLNLDMISRGDDGVLWASGTSHWPRLVPVVESVEVPDMVTLRLGFDSSDAPQDWTLLSDHMVFYRKGIPHLYLGVEDHEDYHKPTDDFEKIDQDWYLAAVETALRVTKATDAALDDISAMKNEGAR